MNFILQRRLPFDHRFVMDKAYLLLQSPLPNISVSPCHLHSIITVNTHYSLNSASSKSTNEQ